MGGCGLLAAGSVSRDVTENLGPTLLIAAQTLPEENASTSILRKLGFRLHGSVHHPDNREIWEWRL